MSLEIDMRRDEFDLHYDGENIDEPKTKVDCVNTHLPFFFVAYGATVMSWLCLLRPYYAPYPNA